MFVFFTIVTLLVIIGILLWQLENAAYRINDAETDARFYKRRYEDIRSELWCLDLSRGKESDIYEHRER